LTDKKPSAQTQSNKPDPKVDAFMRGLDKWQEEMKELRKIIREFPLTEEYKWMHPCYSLDKGNVVLIHGFKEYCAILFIKGALLKDPKHVLIQQTENVQAGRQIRFTSLKDIIKMKTVLKAYIKEAIEVEKTGLKVPHKKTLDFKVPDEFKDKLDKIPGLKTAFEALTPGRQRGYIFYFSQAKQSQPHD